MRKVTQNKVHLKAQPSVKKVLLISTISLVVLGFLLSQVSGSSNVNEKDESGAKTKNGVDQNLFMLSAILTKMCEAV